MSATCSSGVEYVALGGITGVVYARNRAKRWDDRLQPHTVGASFRSPALSPAGREPALSRVEGNLGCREARPFLPKTGIPPPSAPLSSPTKIFLSPFLTAA